MKRILLGVIIGIMISGSAFAAGLTVSKVSYKVSVDGKEVTAEKLNYNGKTYLEMRQVAELLGAKVEWDGKKADIYSKDYVKPPEDVGVKEVKVIVNGIEEPPRDPTSMPKVYIKNGELMVNVFTLGAIGHISCTFSERSIFKYRGAYVTFIRGTNKYETPREKKTAKIGSEMIDGLPYYQMSVLTSEFKGIEVKFECDILYVTAK